MPWITVHAGEQIIASIEIDPHTRIRIEQHSSPDDEPTAIVFAGGSVELPEPDLAPAALTFFCADCDGDLDGTGEPGSCDCPDGSPVGVELTCPRCGSGDLVEVNTAELWSPITELGWDPRRQVLLMGIPSPVYGDWEHDSWACSACQSRFRLPCQTDVDYR